MSVMTKEMKPLTVKEAERDLKKALALGTGTAIGHAEQALNAARQREREAVETAATRQRLESEIRRDKAAAAQAKLEAARDAAEAAALALATQVVLTYGRFVIKFRMLAGLKKPDAQVRTTIREALTRAIHYLNEELMRDATAAKSAVGADALDAKPAVDPRRVEFVKLLLTDQLRSAIALGAVKIEVNENEEPKAK